MSFSSQFGTYKTTLTAKYFSSAVCVGCELKHCNTTRKQIPGLIGQIWLRGRQGSDTVIFADRRASHQKSWNGTISTPYETVLHEQRERESELLTDRRYRVDDSTDQRPRRMLTRAQC